MKKEDFHTIASTAIIFKRGKVLIAQRNANEKSWPLLWVVPGGKLQYGDYKKIKRNKDGLWYNAVEMSLRREVKEEVGLEIKNIDYICDMTFQRNDKTLGMILSYMADWAKGKVKQIYEECVSGKRICGDCKCEHAEYVVNFLKAHQPGWYEP